MHHCACVCCWKLTPLHAWRYEWCCAPVWCVDEWLTVAQRRRWVTEQRLLFQRQHSKLSIHHYSLHSRHISITLSYTLTAHPCRHTRWRTTHRCTMSQQHQCWQSHAVRCLNMLCCKLCHQNRRTHEVMKLNHHLDCSLCVCVCGWGQRHHTTMHDHMLMFVVVGVVGDVYWWCVVSSVDHLARVVKVAVEHQVSHLHCYFHWKSLSHWRKIDRESHTHCERAPFVVVVEKNEKNMLSSRRRTIHTWCQRWSCVPHADTPCWRYKHHFVSLPHVATP